jgi:hypothetical protein
MYIFDIVMVVLFVVVLTIIVGLNIVSIIDRKIGNIEIIIPPINPNIINSNISGKPVEGFESTKPKYEIKVGDSPQTMMAKDISSNIERNPKPNIHNPDDSNVVEYGQYICFKKDNTNNVNKSQSNNVSEEKPVIKQETGKKVCYNESLNNKFAQGKEDLPSGVGSQLSWYDIDPANFYKKYKAPIIPIEDELIKGYNMGEFVTSGGVNDIGKIDLNNRKQKYAQPNNYILNDI